MIIFALFYSIFISLFAGESYINQLILTGHLDKLTFSNSKTIADNTKHTPHAELEMNNPWETITIDDLNARLLDKPTSHLNYLKARLLLENKRISSIEDLSQIRSSLLEACNGNHPDALHLAAVMIDQDCVFKRDFTTISQALTYCETALKFTKNKTQKAELNTLKTKLEKYLEEEIEKANKPKKKKSSDKKTTETAEQLADKVLKAQNLKSLTTQQNIGKLQSEPEPNDQVTIALSRLLRANGQQENAIKALLKAQSKDSFNQNILKEIHDTIDHTSQTQQKEIASRCIDILKNTTIEQEYLRKVPRSILIMLANRYQEITSMCVILRAVLEDTDHNKFRTATTYLDVIFDKLGRKTEQLKILLTKIDSIDSINAFSQIGITESNKSTAKLFQAQFKIYLGENTQENCAKIKEAADEGDLMAAYRYARLIKNGTVQESEETMLQYFKSAATRMPKAAFEVGKILCNPESSNYNVLEGANYLSAAAAKDSLEAKELLAHLYCTIRTPDFEWNIPLTVIKRYLEESKETSGRACLHLGLLKQDERKTSQAIEEFKHGISMGNQECIERLVNILMLTGKNKEVIEAVDTHLPKIKDNRPLWTGLTFSKYLALSLNKRTHFKAEEYLKELKSSENPLAIIHHNAGLLEKTRSNPEDEKICTETMSAIASSMEMGYGKAALMPQIDRLKRSMQKRGGKIWKDYGVQLTKDFAETQE